ncbi:MULTISPECIES: preprotein translocase subunit YajC [unclassified Streptomyces]|uniref:preprotein translocase subunit YajC n=1 Tax=unclassified Streptomyces TaxID=2593676 RepID=UPI003826FB85
MNLIQLLPFVLIIGVMLLMTRSAKNKQRQAVNMRDQMAPGAGIRTIGGMYAVVKEVNDDTVLLELADGVHAHFAKNAIAAVLDQAEYDRIVHGIEPEPEPQFEATDAEHGDDSAEDEDRVDLAKSTDEAKAQDAPKTDGTDSK